MTYHERVLFYIAAEYSDVSLAEMVASARFYFFDGDGEPQLMRLRDIEATSVQKLRSARWWRKVDQIISTYEDCEKAPADAARKVADILKAIAGKGFVDGVEST
jgi:hypothetical protein